MPGMLTSSRIRSGRSDSARAIACTPSVALIMSPSSARRLERIIRFVSASSTISIFWRCGSWPPRDKMPLLSIPVIAPFFPPYRRFQCHWAQCYWPLCHCGYSPARGGDSPSAKLPPPNAIARESRTSSRALLNSFRQASTSGVPGPLRNWSSSALAA